MKRCPKCDRTYTTPNQKFCVRDGESLVEEVAPDASVQPFDPYKTLTDEPSAPSEQTPSSPLTSAPSAASSVPPAASSAPPAASSVPPAASSVPPVALTSASQVPRPPAHPQTAPPLPEKSKRARLIVGLLAVLFMLVIGVAVVFLLVVRPMLANRRGMANSNQPTRKGTLRSTATATPSVAPGPRPSEQPVVVRPPNSTEFVNARRNLDGKLAEHYVDFSFYYPNNWIRDPEAGVPGAKNFAKVERRLPPDLTQESFAVGWYTSTGSEEVNRNAYPQLAQKLSLQYQKEFPEYRKVSQGEARVGIYQAYEFRFAAVARGTANGDLRIWGRTVFLPAREGENTGAILLMLATSLARELKSPGDVGVKGELPVILESFRLGKK
ncbi:MAG TPA: hypothetical protein VKD91_12035 [Pyrinomonadaceae bacterium]|nr:hypothetical protein [Pyrinomonadaceae bacterium]